MKQSLAVVVLALFAPGESGFFGVSSINSYREAEKICQTSGGVLASFHDDSEYAYAVEVCERMCDTYDSFNDRCGCWVGLVDWGQENNFKWQDRSDKEYVMSSSGSAYTGVYPWYTGEPDNYGAESSSDKSSYSGPSALYDSASADEDDDNNNVVIYGGSSYSSLRSDEDTTTRGVDCVHMWKAQSYLLNDANCADKYFAICEENTIEYFSIQSQYIYRDAAAECRGEGGVLASFHSDQDFSSVQTVCEEVCDTVNPGNKYCGCWVGLKDLREEDVWHWEDKSFRNYVMLRTGAPVAGAPWYPGEPDDYADEDCASVWKLQGYSLDDVKCAGYALHAICTRYVPNRLPTILAEERVLAAAPLVIEHSATQWNVLAMVGLPAAVMLAAVAACACYPSKRTGEHKALLQSKV